VCSTLRNVKSKVFLVHTVKTHRWSGGTAPRIPYLGTKWRWVLSTAILLWIRRVKWQQFYKILSNKHRFNFRFSSCVISVNHFY